MDIARWRATTVLIRGGTHNGHRDCALVKGDEFLGVETRRDQLILRLFRIAGLYLLALDMVVVILLFVVAALTGTLPPGQVARGGLFVAYGAHPVFVPSSILFWIGAVAVVASTVTIIRNAPRVALVTPVYAAAAFAGVGMVTLVVGTAFPTAPRWPHDITSAALVVFACAGSLLVARFVDKQQRPTRRRYPRKARNV
ncbi:hypothetical protein E3O44_00055 [Cryobacterium algoricola]|uniref:Uncharacterized protein n=1 Tax=Cryobacterium algoricola TaxID=1259183 RepID=A0ABY2IHJ3_9MICO|nr:hypothetical protein E3O44_00055 [Cryobacterium algoricola]